MEPSFYDTLRMHPVFFWLLHWCVAAVALKVTSYFVRGFEVGGFLSAMLIALFIGIADHFLRPILLFLTLPFNIITLGLFTFVVDGIILKICAAFMPGFEIKSWWTAIFGAFILAVLSTVLHYFIV